MDGLEYLVAEALRTRRSDLAEELVKTLHAIADMDDRERAQIHGRSLRLVHLAAAPSHERDEPEAANVIHIHGRGHPARGLHLCLQLLQAEATAFNMPFLAHLIGVASEAADIEAGQSPGS